MNSFRRSGTPVVPLKRGLTCFDLMTSATVDEVNSEEYPTAVQISSQRNGMLSNLLRRSVFRVEGSTDDAAARDSRCEALLNVGHERIQHSEKNEKTRQMSSG